MAAISCSAASKWPPEQPKGAGVQRFCALGKQGECAKTLPEALKWLRAAISGLPQHFRVLPLLTKGAKTLRPGPFQLFRWPF